MCKRSRAKSVKGIFVFYFVLSAVCDDDDVIDRITLNLFIYAEPKQRKSTAKKKYVRAEYLLLLKNKTNHCFYD